MLIVEEQVVGLGAREELTFPAQALEMVEPSHAVESRLPFDSPVHQPEAIADLSTHWQPRKLPVTEHLPGLSDRFAVEVGAIACCPRLQELFCSHCYFLRERLLQAEQFDAAAPCILAPAVATL